MNFTIDRVDNKKLKMLVISMIVSTKVCSEIIPVLRVNLDLFYEVFESFYKPVVTWIIDFYELTEKAPEKHIQNIFDDKSEKLEGTEKSLIQTFLKTLNDEYVKYEKYNEDYAIDQAKIYLREANLALLTKKISAATKAGKLDDAENYIATYNQIEAKTQICQETSIVYGKEFWDDDPDNNPDSLFIMPGALGDIAGPFARGDFVAFNGPKKRGKSFWLKQIAIWAMESNLNVIYFNMEMAHKKCIRRFRQYFSAETLRLKDKKTGYDEIRIPKFIEAGDESGQWEMSYTMKKKKGVTKEKSKNKQKQLQIKYRGDIRFITYAANSLTLSIADKKIDEYFNNGFVADVIIFDSMDLLKSGKRDQVRQEINEKWGVGRELAQKKHALIVTVSHTNKETNKRAITGSDFQEDDRKGNWLTAGFGLNQTEDEKETGIMRVNCLVSRDNFFTSKNFVYVLECRDIGKIYLDSRHQWEIKNNERSSNENKQKPAYQ